MLLLHVCGWYLKVWKNRTSPLVNNRTISISAVHSWNMSQLDSTEIPLNCELYPVYPVWNVFCWALMKVSDGWCDDNDEGRAQWPPGDPSHVPRPPPGPYLMSHVTQPVKLSPPVTQSLGDRERVTVVTENLEWHTHTVPINVVTSYKYGHSEQSDTDKIKETETFLLGLYFLSILILYWVD